MSHAHNAWLFDVQVYLVAFLHCLSVITLQNRRTFSILAAAFSIVPLSCCLLNLPAYAAPPKAAAAGAKVTSSKKGRSYKVWHLSQKNMIFGDCEVYVCAQGLKVTFASNKWANLALPPDWDLLVFNPKARVYCRTPLKEWRGRKLGSSLLKIKNPIDKMETIAGLRARAYEGQSIDAGKRSSAKLFACEDLNLPPQVSTILCGNAAIPPIKGIPLRVQLKGGDSPETTLNTYVAKEEMMPATFFDMPPGYRLVTKPEDVMTGGISDIIEEMVK